MGLKNIIIGVVIGAVTLFFIKEKEKQSADHSSVFVGTSVVARGGSISSLVTGTNYFPDQTAGIIPRRRGAIPAIRFTQQPNRLRELLRESIEEAHFVSPATEELIRFEELFLATLQQQASWSELAAGWSTIGWNIEAWAAGDERFVAVCEPDNQRRGRGLYVIRVDSGSRVALQAPHRFYDTGTGLLTRKLFSEHDVLVAAWNTVHRSQVDLAHYDDHFLNALTRALIRFDFQLVVTQLHGFDDQKRESGSRSASMIVSDSTRYPGRLVRRVAAEQKSVFTPAAVRLFPTEVSELGGTQNRQAREFHNMDAGGFLHLELGRQLREKLTSDASERQRFFSALTSAAAIWQEPRNR